VNADFGAPKLLTDSPLSASLGSPVHLIADPLGTDGKHKHH
jgi:hypothetical protein